MANILRRKAAVFGVLVRAGPARLSLRRCSSKQR